MTSPLDSLDPEAAAAELRERLSLYRIAREGAAQLRELFSRRQRVWSAGTGVVRDRDDQTTLPTRTPW